MLRIGEYNNMCQELGSIIFYCVHISCKYTECTPLYMNDTFNLQRL